MRRNRSTLCACLECGKTFRANNWRVENGGARYCSKACIYKARSNKVELTCETCGTTFERKVSGIRGIRPYCSNACRFARRPQRVILSDDGVTATIPLYARDGTLKAHATIDAADAEWASQYSWHLNVKGYVVHGRGDLLHRKLLGLAPHDGLFGDHIDLDKLNNRRGNLRPATPSESPQNVPARPGSSQYRGVSWIEHQRQWVAYVSVGRKRHHLGFFGDEQDAAEAAREARATLMPFATN